MGKIVFAFLLNCMYLSALVGEIYVAHEWDPLKVAIVGGLRKKNKWALNVSFEKIRAEVAHVIKILQEHNVTLYRFNEFVGAESIGRLPPLFPRDPILVIDKYIVECSMKATHRRREGSVIRDALLPMFVENGAQYLPMPACKNLEQYSRDDCLLEGGNLLINGNELYVGSGDFKTFSCVLWAFGKTQKIWKRLLSEGKLNSLHQYLDKMRTHSFSSLNAIKWLEKFFASHYKIYEIKLKTPFYADLDGCLALVAPGLGIVYPDAIASELPDSIKNWDFIKISLQELKNNAANILSLDEKTVMIDNRNQRVAQELRNRGISVIEVPFSEIGKLEGGLRCFHQALLRKN